MHIAKWLFINCLLITLTLSSVSAKDKAYFGGQISAVMVEDSPLSVGSFDILDMEFKPGYGIAAIGGYDYGDFRLEGEITYRTNDIDTISMSTMSLNDVDADVSTLSLMVNGFYDVETDTPFAPYIGGGVGFANVDLDSEDDIVFAYQLGLGVGYAIDENVTLDLGYRYFATSNPEFEGGIEAEYTSHNIVLGIRGLY